MSWSIRTVLAAHSLVNVRRAAGPAALACALLLGTAGCSSAERVEGRNAPEPSASVASSPSATSEPSPDEATAQTAEVEPTDTPSEDSAQGSDPLDRSVLLVQPDAMRKANRAGAVAAAKYYMGLYEYVYLTGDLEMWEQMADPQCEFCAIAAKNVRKLHDASRYQESGPPKWIGRVEVDQIATMPRWHVTLRARVSGARTLDVDGPVIEKHKPAKARVTLAMHHDGNAWRTIDIRVSDDG